MLCILQLVHCIVVNGYNYNLFMILCIFVLEGMFSDRFLKRKIVPPDLIIGASECLYGSAA